MYFFCNCAFESKTMDNRTVSGLFNLFFQADSTETAGSYLRDSIIIYFELNFDHLDKITVFVESVVSFKELPTQPCLIHMQIRDCSLSNVLSAAFKMNNDNNVSNYSLRYKNCDEKMLNRPIPLVDINKRKGKIWTYPDTKLVEDEVEPFDINFAESDKHNLN